MRHSSEVLSDEAIAAMLGEDTFARLDRGLERLWDAIWTDGDADAEAPTVTR